VEAVAQSMEGLADSKAEAAGASGYTVEFGVELGDFAYWGSRSLRARPSHGCFVERAGRDDAWRCSGLALDPA
jgi:hypothetical protein